MPDLTSRPTHNPQTGGRLVYPPGSDEPIRHPVTGDAMGFSDELAATIERELGVPVEVQAAESPEEAPLPAGELEPAASPAPMPEPETPEPPPETPADD